MKSTAQLRFLFAALLFHGVYIVSIFDIYFRSPIVQGMDLIDPDESYPIPAKRLVLFVGDGLRADKTFQSFPDPWLDDGVAHIGSTRDAKPMAPFLRSRVLEHGTFGISHTRVPTESRPGHVALIAGLYEDVSSVTTGWTTNPVGFDSVFNRSSHTWSWGSPDILLMFQDGAVPGRVDAFVYDPEDENFAADATKLDSWVFDHVKEFFSSAKSDPGLSESLSQHRVVLFLHLLGIDSTGHVDRPYSKRYLRNIQAVDNGIREMTGLINDFYDDEATAFIFTADHGMSDWGSHGDGHPDNTRTPLIAWGAGIAPPRVSPNTTLARGHEDGLSSDWGLSNIERHDVQQADIAALMAHLIGVPFPANSEGKLPLEYLNGAESDLAKAALLNVRQLGEMYTTKDKYQHSKRLGYTPFHAFPDNSSLGAKLAANNQLIAQGNFETSIKRSHELFDLLLRGLRYMQTYDWMFLKAIVASGFIGWLLYTLTLIIEESVLTASRRHGRSVLQAPIDLGLACALGSFMFSQQSPASHYIYAGFALVLWDKVFTRARCFVDVYSRQSGRQIVVSLCLAAGLVVFLELIVQSYFHRSLYSAIYFLASAWPLTFDREFATRHAQLCGAWACSCLFMSVFTLLSVIKVESTLLISLGGYLTALLGLLFVASCKTPLAIATTSANSSSEALSLLQTLVFSVQITLIPCSVYATQRTVPILKLKQGLPWNVQALNWSLLTISLVLPVLYFIRPLKYHLSRMAALLITLGPTFVFLTISYEGFFFVAFTCTVTIWSLLEVKLRHFRQVSPGATKKRATKTTTRKLEADDVRIAVFLLFLLQSAFFSTGNIASVSSFSLDAVFRLYPVFDPFVQGALLLFKLLAPFVVVAANLGVLSRQLELPPGSLFMLLSVLADVLSLSFFFLVRDEGSWLEIGTGISHFCIASALSILVFILELLGRLFRNGIIEL